LIPKRRPTSYTGFFKYQQLAGRLYGIKCTLFSSFIFIKIHFFYFSTRKSSIYNVQILFNCYILFADETKPNEKSGFGKFLLHFSLSKNWSDLFSTRELQQKSIDSIDGLRFINTCLVVLCHINNSSLQLAYINTKYLYDVCFTTQNLLKKVYLKILNLSRLPLTSR